MRWPAWLGVGERRWKKSADEEVQPAKTAWDFLQLLIVPAILVVIALAFNASQASRDRSREDRRVREDRALAAHARQDAVLDAYLTKMSNLILDRGLGSSRARSTVSQVARTATLTSLRRLDGSRKGELVRFLHEAGFLEVEAEACRRVAGEDSVECRDGARVDPVVSLDGADLRGVDLSGVDLSPTDGANRLVLSGDLRGARFDRARLQSVDFGDAGRTDLRGASFNDAQFSVVSVRDVDLRGASFRAAFLADAHFDNSDLGSATFDDVDIAFGTSFLSTCLSNASFVGARFNTEAGESIGGRTSFAFAKGQNVDFSDAVNLATVRLGPQVKARFDGARGRPTAPTKPSPRGFYGCSHFV